MRSIGKHPLRVKQMFRGETRHVADFNTRMIYERNPGEFFVNWIGSKRAVTFDADTGFYILVICMPKQVTRADPFAAFNTPRTGA